MGHTLFGLPDPLTATTGVSGSVVIESDQGLVGSIAFGDAQNGQFLASLPLLSTSSAKRELFLDHVAIGTIGDVPYFTGIALVNPSTSSSTVKLGATFRDIGGVARRGAAILIADSGNNRIRAVVPPPLPDDLVIDLATSPAFLDSLNAVPGSILMINVDGREYLVVPNATSVGLDVTITGNDQLVVIDLNALQSAGGNINIAGNLTLQSIDMSGLTTVGGSMTVTDNPALNVILISGVTTIGSDLTVVGTAATVIDMSSLTTVGGDLAVSGNTMVSSIDLGGITTMTGNIDVSGNSSVASIDLSALTTVGGSLTIGDNAAAHLKSSRMGASVTIPVHEGRPMFGKWQGVFFGEFDGPRQAREARYGAKRRILDAFRRGGEIPRAGHRRPRGRGPYSRSRTARPAAGRSSRTTSGTAAFDRRARGTNRSSTGSSPRSIRLPRRSSATSRTSS
mgnify:CR=1 FL=1